MRRFTYEITVHDVDNDDEISAVFSAPTMRTQRDVVALAFTQGADRCEVVQINLVTGTTKIVH